MAQILIIDDSQAQAFAQAFQLWNGGHQVHIALNARQALEHLKQDLPDLVLLDYELPDLSGLDLFRRLKKDHPDIPVIMLTGKGNEKLAARILKEGASDYLVKSTETLDTLAQTVDLVLHQEQMRRELAEKEEELQQAYASLEKKVRERTAELERTNHLLRLENQERRRAEDALIQSEARLRSIFQAAPIGIGVVKGREIQWVNDRMTEMTGYSRGELENHDLNLLFETSNEFDRVSRVLSHRMLEQGKVTVDTVWLSKHGTRIQVLLSAAPLDASNPVAGSTITALDTTSRQKALKALEQSEKRYRLLFDSAPDGILILDPDKRILDLNPSSAALLGRSHEELVGRTLKEFLAQESRDLIRYSADPAQGHEAQECEIQLVDRENQPKDVWRKAVPMTDAQGDFSGMLVFDRDIQDRKKAERALVAAVRGTAPAEGEEFFFNLVNHLAVALEVRYCLIAELLPKRRARTLAVWANQGFVENYEYELNGTPDEKVLEQNGSLFLDQVHQIFPWGPREKSRGSFMGMALRDSAGRPLGLLAVMDHEKPRSVPLAESMLRIFSTRAAAELERKKSEEEKIHLERRLRQAQKMEAVGTLAGGIAHDFNNILGAIIGYAELMRMNKHTHSDLEGHIEPLLQAAQRAKDLVHRILTFSRQTAPIKKPMDIKPLIAETVRFLRSSLPSTIEIQSTLGAISGRVRTDPTLIQQLVMNLGVNAAQAMGEKGGLLEVGCSEIMVAAGDLAESLALVPGPYCLITVSDTGHGMTEEVRERIFEPYFSTKQPGEGTGLGLAVVHGIVTSHQGAIRVRSAPGEGTTFSVFLPTTPQAEALLPDLDDTEPPRGTERILLVDDEPGLADTGRRLLSRLGYWVVSSTSSEEALALFQQSPSEFDLVITDQTMPRMTGAELASRLIELKPDLPVIVCSGFCDSIDAEKSKQLGIKAFLTKPLLMKELAVAVRGVLDEIRPGH